MKVGPGCDHCYAELGNNRYYKGRHWGAQGPRRDVGNWRAKINEAKRAAIADGHKKRVFVASLADIFEKPMPMESAQAVPLDITTGDRRKELFEVIDNTPECTFLLLTKRPQNINKYMPDHWKDSCPSNVWFGCTVVNQAEADRDIPHLLQSPGFGNKFLSIEPMLEPINLDAIWIDCPTCNGDMTGCINEFGGMSCTHCLLSAYQGKVSGISWCIVGGESGHNLRPMRPEWVTSIMNQCKEARVPFFFKQWGAWKPMQYEAESGTIYRMIKNPDQHDGTWIDGKTYQDYPQSMTSPIQKSKVE